MTDRTRKELAKALRLAERAIELFNQHGFSEEFKRDPIITISKSLLALHAQSAQDYRAGLIDMQKEAVEAIKKYGYEGKVAVPSHYTEDHIEGMTRAANDLVSIIRALPTTPAAADSENG